MLSGESDGNDRTRFAQVERTPTPARRMPVTESCDATVRRRTALGEQTPGYLITNDGQEFSVLVLRLVQSHDEDCAMSSSDVHMKVR